MRPGQVIGHYRLVEKIGEGSTGSVWKADDRRLRRTVALKILRGGFDGDTETLARFRKESRFLARIDHPGVAAIHDVEEYAGRPVLVLEFVPGESLAEYLAGGPLALTEALRIGIQVASTVHAAHLSGIIHRDLKPGNIKITPDGTARVLDFGLAKSFGASGDTTESSTVNGSFQGTVHGTILGTASYMSPEQARGQSVDQRTDLWSLGCVLFEALSGRKAFPGETMLDTLATVLEREPDWSTLPGNTPDRIHHLLRWCLCKDVGHRLRDMGDAAWEMKQALVEQDAPGPPSPEKEPHTGRRRRAWRFAAAAGAGALLGLGALIAAAGFIMPGRGAVAAHRGRPLDMYAIHLEDLPSVALGDGAGLALSRDGTRLALAGGQVDGSLLIRRMDRFTPRAVPETDGAALPFFSPDGT
ncbi:MAG: protein kinase, partial [Acidobacteriota bacterium]